MNKKQLAPKPKKFLHDSKMKRKKARDSPWPQTFTAELAAYSKLEVGKGGEGYVCERETFARHLAKTLK